MVLIEFLYIPIILLLYWRTHKYNYLIDDPIPRDGYMYMIVGTDTDPCTKEEKLSWYDRKRSLLCTVTNVGVFMTVCSYIHYLWGWQAALLYAVFPLNVSGVAWGRTGNYYMTTTLLVLSAHMLIAQGAVGVLLSPFMYAAALNSTLNGLPYVILAPLNTPLGWVMVAPFILFIFGRRFNKGLIDRHKSNIKVGSLGAGGLHLLEVPRTLAYYICLSLWPSRLGFFHDCNHTSFWYSKKMTALSCLCVVMFILWGCMVDNYMTLWWIVMMLLFSQWISLGQYVSERYTFLANVAFCVIMSKFLQFFVPMYTSMVMYTLLCTLWLYRTHLYIPMWKDDLVLFSISSLAFPRAPDNFNNVGSYYLRKGHPEKAVEALEMGFRLARKNTWKNHANLSGAYGALGAKYKHLGYFTQSLAHLDTALMLVGEDKEGRENLFKGRNGCIDCINKLKKEKK